MQPFAAFCDGRFGEQAELVVQSAQRQPPLVKGGQRVGQHTVSAQRLQNAALGLDFVGERLAHRGDDVLQPPLGLGPVGDDQLGRGRRRGGAQVGGEIADGIVDLVADGRDDRDFGRTDGAREGFVIEGPQVLGRAAAASENDDVGLFFAVERPQRLDHLRRGAVSLDEGGIEQDFRQREAPACDVDHIADGGPRRRGNDADGARVFGQRLLARRVEQPFGGQPAFELLERGEQVARAVLPHRADVEGVLPALDPERHPSLGCDLLPVFGHKVERGDVAPPHHGRDGRALIFNGKINMPRAVQRDVGQLALDADIPKERQVLQIILGQRVQLGDGQRADLGRVHVRALPTATTALLSTPLTKATAFSSA